MAKSYIDEIREMIERSYIEILKSLIALNEQNGKPIDDTAILKVISS